MRELGMGERQFCRKGIHDCIPAVTLTFDGGARRGHWCAEHASDADAYRATADKEVSESGEHKINGFEAIINVPGYLPMSDEPHVFPTAGEAWEWLRDERERDLCDPMNDEPDDEDQCLEEIESMMDQGVPGVVYGRTPGSDSDHDLGLAYSVVQISRVQAFAHAIQAGQWELVPVHASYPHEPGMLYDCPLCESRCFCTGDPGHMPCVFCGQRSDI